LAQHILPAACCLLLLEQQLSERDVQMCTVQFSIMQLTNFILQGPTVIEMYRLYKETNGNRKLMIIPIAMTVVSRDFLLSL
jgi:hypothetical protein